MCLKTCNSQPIRKAMFFSFLEHCIPREDFPKVPCKWKHALLKRHFCDLCGFLLQWRVLWGFRGETALCWSGMAWLPERLPRVTLQLQPLHPKQWLKAPAHPCGKRQSCLPSFLPMWARENQAQAKGWKMQQRQKTSFSFSPSCQVICQHS